MRLNAYQTLRISLAALVLLLLFAELSSAAQTYTVCKGDTLHRISIRYGTTVSALQNANNLKGYALNVGQKLTIPSKDQGPQVIANARCMVNDLKVTSGTTTIAQVSKNTVLKVIGKDGSKVKVKLSDGRIGWVNAESVKMEEIEKPVQVADSYRGRQGMITKALACRGGRYRRGGESTSGFDCSGFVKYLFSGEGVKLPHSSRDQYNYGTPVSRDKLQQGDVVFFAGTYRRGISHVGVYIGNNQFIHAANTRSGVCVSNLNEKYYSSHYYGAKRIN